MKSNANQQDTSSGHDSEDRKDLTDSQNALRALAVAMLIGIFSVIIYALHAGGRENFLGIVSIGILLTGGSIFVGGALGFLFGIPRTLQGDDASRTNDQSVNSSDTATASPRTAYQANTNLEQISDWLTKILVGVGLTQVAELKGGIENLTKFFAKGLGGQDSAQVFAFAILLYSIVLGFFFGYLWTRLYLAGALMAADQALIGSLKAEVKKAAEKAESNERRLDDLKQQSQRDADALNLAYRQLNPGTDLPNVNQDELNVAVALASRPIRIQIFNQAWQIRSQNWLDPKTKSIMELSIPVFRALIYSDQKRQFHANHGQLGFALKDKAQPDWIEAEKELNIAIELRGDRKGNGWLFYEFNRAVCRINIDPEFVQNKPSTQESKERILADLRAAVKVAFINQVLKKESTIQKWITKNQVSEDEIRGA